MPLFAMDPMEVSQDRHDHNVPPLLSMPIEIVSRISSHLDATDICSFRLTCRGLENAVFSDFAERMFGRKQFMISELSLGALCDIAKSRLGRHLKQFHLGLETVFYDPSAFPGDMTEHQQRRCQHYASQQLWLWSSGRVIDLLAEAFRHLPNLQTVVIRDFDSFTMCRDHPHPHDHGGSYGVSAMREDCGLAEAVRVAWTNEVSGPRDYVSQVFTAILVSLGRANARPKALRIYERKGHRLRDLAFQIPSTLAEIIAPVLSGLKDLHLCIQPLTPLPGINYDYSLREFLALAPNLAELRINADRHCVTELGKDSLKSFQQWLAAPPPVSANGGATSTPQNGEQWETLPAPVTFPFLRTLSLGSMTATVKDLLAIIKKFAKFSPKLRRLELWTIALTPEQGSWDTFIDVETTCLWKQFFRGLVKIRDLKLCEVFIGRLRQHHWASNGRELDVFFVQENSERISDKQIDYSGDDWRKYVDGLSMVFSKDLMILRKNGFGSSDHTDGDNGKAEPSETLKQMMEKFIHHVRRLEHDPSDDISDTLY